jgi:transglycosylase-like protein with SLT domain/D-alanyl-D-alanine carboxypeptidase-like protein/putative Flp pilus-assembly TadE/G-like protein
MDATDRMPRVVLATSVGGAGGGAALAASLGVAAATAEPLGFAGPRAVLLLDLDPSPRSRRPTMLASAAARELEDAVRALGARYTAAAARGHLVQLALAGDDSLDRVAELLAARPPASLVVVHVRESRWADAVADRRLGVRAGLLQADLPADRALVALAVHELHERGLRAKVAGRPLGRVAARRALAGVAPGGTISRQAARWATTFLSPRVVPRGDERGQALVTLLGAVAALIVTALVLTAIGGAVTGKARVQRAADLAALSGARSMRDDFDRLFAPSRLPNGLPNPAHLTKSEYLARAKAAALDAAGHNGVATGRVVISFPDAESFSPLRVRARVEAEIDPEDLPGDPVAGGADQQIPVAAHAVAEASPPAGSGFGDMPAQATGGGYSGPLAYRQGKPMRPDVAEAFDRMAAAARKAGISLVINSAYRSDAEQAQLFAQNPDPTWVAPPGQSLHRCATELDLGPSSAYGWLADNARRFGFLKRYPWEPWHFGYVEGPPPCSEEGNSIGESGESADGSSASSGGLPDFVPQKFRAAILRSAAKWNVSAGLLAAQLFAESNFNPFAVSPAGAQGIAQFMPGTAASYGLHDPFDAEAAIDAQAHLMSDLLEQFHSIPLALAAYNAGPGAVAACHCVPSFPETQAYVAKIMGLLDGAGELAAPTLEVRLVE